MSVPATLFNIAARSLWNRRTTAALTVLAIAMSITLFMGVEQLRKSARASFEATLSGTDLLIGARSGDINLLLYAVFRLGNPTNNMSWESYQTIANRREVAWTIPISLGDSVRGFRVIGTTGAYFEHYRFGDKRPLTFAEGEPFDGVFDAVIGAEAAKGLNLSVGDTIILSHGIGDTSFIQHDNEPFRVVGILKPTGTPVDRAVHVSLAGLEAVHQPTTPGFGGKPPDNANQQVFEPKTITAALVGMKSRILTLKLQRQINSYPGEALSAVIPGVALAQLWQVVGSVETVLRVIAGFVILTGLVGMLTNILTSLNERRREMALLRAVGARRPAVFSLLVLEAGLLAGLGSLIGTVFVYVGFLLSAPWIETRYGILLSPSPPGQDDGLIVGAVMFIALALGMIPAWAAYRRSLADGLSVQT
ncbi:MAG: ABC transporter permease [Pseudomonadota bacterium]